MDHLAFAIQLARSMVGRGEGNASAYPQGLVAETFETRTQSFPEFVAGELSGNWSGIPIFAGKKYGRIMV